jgi:hypothetical protein
MNPLLIPPGHRFPGSTLVVIKEVIRTGPGKRQFEVKCDCGTCFQANLGNLRQGKTRSCRQCGWARSTASHRTHGMSNTNAYRAWRTMISRCYNPNQGAYKNYGGRGIRVCQRWLDSFETFLEDMGPRPSPYHTLERVDNSGHYEPGNCRWATRADQARNRRDNRHCSKGIGPATSCRPRLV